MTAEGRMVIHLFCYGHLVLSAYNWSTPNGKENILGTIGDVGRTTYLTPF